MKNKFTKYGKAMRDLRASMKLTQKQFAEKADVHPQFVSNVERGLCFLPRKNFKLLRKNLKLNQPVLSNLKKELSEDLLRIAENKAAILTIDA